MPSAIDLMKFFSRIVAVMIETSEEGKDRAQRPCQTGARFSANARAFARIGGFEYGSDQRKLAGEHLIDRPIAQMGEDLLGHTHGQRTVGRHGAHQRQRLGQRLARDDQTID